MKGIGKGNIGSKEFWSTVRRLAWMVFLFGSACMIISAVATKEASQVTDVAIEVAPLPNGEWLINDEDIKLSIERSFGIPLNTLPLGEVDVERLERVLEEDPFILDAEAYIDAKNRINIEVIQRQPVLRIIDNNGLNYYLDETGVKMPLSKHFTARVLVATGNLPPYSTDFLGPRRNLLQDVFALSKLLRADEFLNALTEQLHLSNRGEITMVPKMGKQEILFGRFNNATDKLERLKIFYREGVPYEGWRKYRTIDLRYDGQVVCKKR